MVAGTAARRLSAGGQCDASIFFTFGQYGASMSLAGISARVWKLDVLQAESSDSTMRPGTPAVFSSHSLDSTQGRRATDAPGRGHTPNEQRLRGGGKLTVEKISQIYGNPLAKVRPHKREKL